MSVQGSKEVWEKYMDFRLQRELKDLEDHRKNTQQEMASRIKMMELECHDNLQTTFRNLSLMNRPIRRIAWEKQQVRHHVLSYYNGHCA